MFAARKMLSAGMGAREFILNLNTNLALGFGSTIHTITSLATEAGWNGGQRLIVNFNAPIFGNVVFGTSTFPGGVRLVIPTGRKIGGLYWNRGNDPGNSGYVGNGRAITIPDNVSAVEIDNQGVICSGGGMGGNGGNASWSYSGNSETVFGGSGGAGDRMQVFSTFSGTPNPLNITEQARTDGYPGGYSEYTGVGFPGARPWAQAGQGGRGGQWGQAGDEGQAGAYGGAGSGSAANGGTGSGPYVAINGSSKITWINTGTIIGSVIA